jgi:hypothetical protein
MVFQILEKADILSKDYINKKQLLNTIWKFTKITVAVDGGTFGFWVDTSLIKS